MTKIDLLILALGVDGNYANVMPGTPVSVGWHVAHLSEKFRQSHTGTGSASFEHAHFRNFGMSLGPQQVLSASNVVVIISGARKRELATRLLQLGKFDPQFPLSVIYHPAVRDRVRVFITRDVGIGLP